MEAKKRSFARELVASSSYARNSKTNLILILIFIALIIFAFNVFIPKKSYASNTNIEMTEKLLTTIFEHYSDSRYNNYYNSNYQAGFNQSIPNLLNSVNKTQAVTKINEQLNLIKPNIDSGINNNDIVVEFFWTKGSWGAQLTFYFFVPKETIRKDNFLMLTYTPSSNTYNYYIDFLNHSRNDYEVIMTIDVNPYNSINSIYYGYNNFANTAVTSNTESLQINNNQISLPFLLAFKNNCGITYNSNVYYLTEYIEQEQSYIEEQTISENGYRIWSGDPIQIKLNDNNKLLNNYFFVGNNLTYNNEYYYYDNNNKIYQKHQLISELKTDYQISGDTIGKLVQPEAMWVRYYDYFGKDIYQDLTFYYYSGDELLEEIKAIENQKVITWIDSNNQIVTGTTGTITNSSGDVIGNFSGDNDETNIVNFLTQQPNLNNKTISSGEIIDAIGIQQTADPYENFWYEFSTGLGEALTDTSNSLQIDWIGAIHVINADYFDWAVPEDLKGLISTVSLVAMTWSMMKMIKKITNDIQSGLIMHNTQFGDETYLIYM